MLSVHSEYNKPRPNVQFNYTHKRESSMSARIRAPRVHSALTCTVNTLASRYLATRTHLSSYLWAAL